MKPTLLENLRIFYGADQQHTQQMRHLYSDQALLKRESLMFDVDVQKSLRKFWVLYDANGSGTISKEEYVGCNKLVQRVLSTRFSSDDVERIAIEDWQSDSGGCASTLSLDYRYGVRLPLPSPRSI